MLFKFGGIFRNVWRGALLLGTLVIGANSLFVAPVSAAAGVNQQLNFQGRLLNAQGAVVVDGYYNVEFKIYQDGPGTAASNPGGTLKWTEDWLNSGGSPVKVVNGYMSVQLGSINPFGNSIDWNQDTIWLSINIGNTTSCTITTNFNANCGGDGEMLPMKRLSAVPYALNSAKLGGLTAAGFIQNTTTVQTATNMAIDGTARADTSILTPLVDTNSAVALNIGTTNATAINLNQNVTVAANKSLTLAGGSTANRPASPTEGMMWYDTTTKQLVVYSNGKWQADRNTSTKIVAASNASQALKDGADYVADGTGDQTEINAALTAAAGGKVYLTEGTFTINASVSVPNNTTLAGAGAGTVITIPNAFNTNIDAITNTTTGGNGTGITIQDLRLEGNKANQTSNTMRGIYFNGVGSGSGSSAIQGSKVTGTWVNGWRNTGIYLNISFNNTLTGNTANTNNDNGFYLGSGNSNTLTGNIAQGNTGYGFSISSSENTVTGNTSQGNSTGFGVFSYDNTFTGNTSQGNASYGFYLSGTSAYNNIISSNKITNNGGNTNNNAIYFDASDSNTITGNNITDSSATTTNYAINISNSTSDTNYLADNTFSSTPGTATIRDLGTGTVYANQSRAENGGQLTNRTADNATAFQVQNASGAGILTADTSAGEIEIGSTALAGKLVISDGSSNTVTLSVGALAGDYTLGIPTMTANDTLCLVTAANCANGTMFIQNQNASQQTANSWISGSARADTSLQAPLIDTATAVALNIGTTNATVINLNKDTVVAADKSLTITGSGTRPASPTEGMVYFDTTTKQLLTYANGKWQADGKVAVIVAANNSSVADKGAADYVTTGTGDQTIINTALSAASPAGTRKTGKVVLLGGTYTLSAAITIPNDTTLSGTGTASVITIPNAQNGSYNMIQNTDTGTGTHVTISNLMIDGNKANQTSGATNGIYFNGMGAGSGASARDGGKITNVVVKNVYGGRGISLSSSSNNTVTGNTTTGSGITGISLNSSSNNTLTDNTTQGNATSGISLNSSSNNNTVSGNIAQGNNYGIYLNSSANNTVASNTTQGNTVDGISLVSSSANNTVTGNTAQGNTTNGISLNTSSSNNTVSANTTQGNNYGIYLSSANNNTITDTSAWGNTTTGISLNTSSGNTLTGNTAQGNTSNGISLNGSSTNNTVSGNTAQGNSGYGIFLNSSSNNTVSVNKIHDDGGSTTNNGIYLDAADKNTITGNSITDTSATTTNYAINISNSTSDTNYLADNTFSSTPATSTINDAGTGTVYANQSRTENGGQLTNRTANDTQAFAVQNAAGTNILAVDTANSKVLVAGTLDTTTATTLNIGSANATAISIGKAGITTTILGSTAVNPQTSTSTTLLCSNAGVISTCDSSVVAPTGTNFIKNQTGQQASANFNISGTGIASTLQAATFDTNSAATLNIGTTNATSIALNQNVTVAAGKSLTLAGGTTASRPASPTEGMLWFDTTTKQLLVYSNGKWQADSKTSSVIVAASNSPQAVKDGAQYVADGTNDQVEINAAITALTSGGKVYLAEGTYTIGAGVDMKTNIQLVGSGSSTVVQLANFGATSTNIAAIRFDSISNASVENFKLDGRSSVNTAGTQHGISVNWGSNVTVSKVTISNFRSNGVDMFYESNAAIKDNYISGNGTGISIYTVSSSYNSVMNNTIIGNTNAGISLSQSSHNTVQGNTIENNNGSGIDAETNYSAIAKNHIAGNVGGGVKTYSSSFNQITSNALYDNGGATQNTAIELGSSSSNNTVTNNTIADSSCTSSCYAVSITNSNSSSNYLADNTLGGGTVNDLGTGTIYAGQFASSTSFLLQPATNITIGGAATTTTLQGNTAVTLSTTTGTTLVCQNGTSLLSTCDASYLTPTATNFIRNQNGAVQSGGTFWIGGSGRADTSLLTPTLDTATAGTLSVGTATASGITLGKSGVATTAAGGLLSANVDATATNSLTIGGTNATSISIGKSSIATNLSSSTLNVGTSGSATNILGAAQTTANTAGDALVIRGSTGLGTGTGGAVTIQGGNAGATNANGGNLTLAGGTGSGTGVSGLVIINNATYSTSTTQASAVNANVTQANIDSFGAIILNATGAGVNFTLTSPTLGASAAGRVIYVTAANGSQDFTLRANVGGGTGVEQNIAMRQNTTATMIWNGSQWTAAGASSSTTLQAAYDNTLQSAGGAELVVSKTGTTNGLTIRDSSSAPVNGTLLSIQTKTASTLLSVNSNVTDYATNGGAETAFATDWALIPSSGATVSRNTTAANIAVGTGSVSVTTATSANSGARNTLSAALTPGLRYNVSFTAKLSSGNFVDLNVNYSNDGTNANTACTNYSTQAIATSVWTKVNCTFTAPASTSATNAIFIRQTASGTARTFYVDNLSVTIGADQSYATDGDVNDSANFGSNWQIVTGGGTASATRDTDYGYRASDSAKATISTATAGAGIKNKLSINPLATTPGTLYRITAYASSTTAMTDFTIRYSRDNGTSFDACVDYNTQTLSGSASDFKKITCYVTVSSTAASNAWVFFTQGAGAARSIYVDSFSMTIASNTTPNVQVGGGVTGGPTTLFTLDKGASAPIANDNDALLGSMYYDTTLGKLQCYEADGWGACGSSPDTVVTISPEYTNAVLHGTGVGTMTSDICSDTLNINDATNGPVICGTNETYNFYKWTSPQASPQTYSIYVTYQLPSTFKEFASGQTSLMGRTNNANAAVSYRIFRSDENGLTPCSAAVSVSTGVQTSWQTKVASGAADPSTCGFEPGDSVVFQIDMVASTTANAYVSNLNFVFSNR